MKNRTMTKATPCFARLDWNEATPDILLLQRLVEFTITLVKSHLRGSGLVQAEEAAITQFQVEFGLPQLDRQRIERRCR